MLEFKKLCGLLSVHGTIDSTHISISKPKLDFVKDFTFIRLKDIRLSRNMLLMLERSSLTFKLAYLEV
jgi:hypothetical protein